MTQDLPTAQCPDTPSHGPPLPYLSLYQPANTLGNTPWAFFINKLMSEQNLTKMTPSSVNLLEGRQNSLQPWSWVHFYDQIITEVNRLETANSKRKVALQFDWLAVRVVNTRSSPKQNSRHVCANAMVTTYQIRQMPSLQYLKNLSMVSN